MVFAGLAVGVATISHEILVSLNALWKDVRFKKTLQDRYILYFTSPGTSVFECVFRKCGTVPRFRTRLGWISGSAESITAVSELSNAPRLSRCESAKPAARWRFGLPGRGWM